MLEILEDRLTPSTTWTVNVATDNGGAGGQGNGNLGDLRYCVTHAASGDTVVFATGLNNQTINLNSQIQVSQAVTLTTQNDPKNPVNLTISGQNKTRLFWVLRGSSVTLTGLTITGGNGTDGQGNAGNGGAILVNYLAFLTLNNDTFNNNATTGAGTNGGAIENDGVASVYGCTFGTNNSVNSGGAIENTHDLSIDTSSSFGSNIAVVNGGAIDSSGAGAGQLTVDNSDFTNNKARKGGAINTNDVATLFDDTFGQGGANISTGEGGGALYATAGVTVNSCQFANNQALAPGNGSGGAIYSSAQLDVEQSTFTGNSAANYGGAIDANMVNQGGLGDFVLTLNLDTFTSNTAIYGGGVAATSVANSGRNQVSITNDTFYQNHAQSTGNGVGGGLYLQEGTGGGSSNVTSTLTNDTFFQNTSDNHGGGLALILNDSTGSNNALAVLTSLTVNNNTAATDSGGLYIDTALNGVVSVDNSILSGNLVTASGYKGTVDVSMTNNAALGTEQFNLVGTSDNTYFMNNNDILTDTPRLAGFLAANGAPENYPQTLALQAASPGFEKGDPNLAGQSGANGVDERGFNRQAGKVSIGAEDPDAQFVPKGQSSTSLTSSVNPATPNQAVTFTANVTTYDYGTPTGTVTFMADDTIVGEAELDSNGNATLTTSALALGNHTITAVYNGDANYTSSAGFLTQTVSLAASNTYVGSSTNPAQPGDPVTFTAYVSAANGGSGIPTGTVTFYNGTAILGTIGLTTVNGQAQASLTTSFGTGQYAIMAVYTGDNMFADSSASAYETVGQPSSQGSSLFLTSSASSALPGQAVTFTASVNGMNGTPTGSVTFLDGTTLLATVPLNANGQASYTTSTLALGAHDITAIYSGDGTYAGSDSSLTQYVVQGGTTTSLASSANPSPQGQEVTFTATVAAMGMGSVTPTGTVSFYDGTTFLGSGTLSLVNGQYQATFTTAALGLGSHTIVAIYSGDSTFADSGTSLQETITS